MTIIHGYSWEWDTRSITRVMASSLFLVLMPLHIQVGLPVTSMAFCPPNQSKSWFGYIEQTAVGCYWGHWVSWYCAQHADLGSPNFGRFKPAAWCEHPMTSAQKIILPFDLCLVWTGMDEWTKCPKLKLEPQHVPIPRIHSKHLATQCRFSCFYRTRPNDTSSMDHKFQLISGGILYNRPINSTDMAVKTLGPGSLAG